MAIDVKGTTVHISWIVFYTAIVIICAWLLFASASHAWTDTMSMGSQLVDALLVVALVMSAWRGQAHLAAVQHAATAFRNNVRSAGCATVNVTQLRLGPLVNPARHLRVVCSAGVLGVVTAYVVASAISVFGPSDGAVTWANDRWVQNLDISNGAPLTDAVESRKGVLQYATVRWRPDAMDASGIWCEYFEVSSGWPLACCAYKEWLDHGPGPAVAVNQSKSSGIPMPRWMPLSPLQTLPDRRIPTYIIWGSMLINGLFFGLIMYAAWAGCVLHRWNARLDRGRCAFCGYMLEWRFDRRCSECGRTVVQRRPDGPASTPETGHRPSKEV
jgi:hypothetical protein